MSVTITKRQIEQVIEELVQYRKEIDRDFPEKENFNHINFFKKFLMDNKDEELIDRLISREKEFKIEVLVTEKGKDSIFRESELLLEWENSKKSPRRI